MIRRLALPLVMFSLTPAAAQESEDMLGFQCRFALMVSQAPQRFSAFAPVDIRFTRSGRRISDIHVVDSGGILFPGGNMRAVPRDDATAIEAVEIPAERAGIWRGAIREDLYRLTLEAEGREDAAEVALTTEPRTEDREHVVIWNASHQPEGFPSAISGTGIGYCRATRDSEAAE